MWSLFNLVISKGLKSTLLSKVIIVEEFLELSFYKLGEIF